MASTVLNGIACLRKGKLLRRLCGSCYARPLLVIVNYCMVNKNTLDHFAVWFESFDVFNCRPINFFLSFTIWCHAGPVVVLCNSTSYCWAILRNVTSFHATVNHSALTLYHARLTHFMLRCTISDYNVLLNIEKLSILTSFSFLLFYIANAWNGGWAIHTWLDCYCVTFVHVPLQYGLVVCVFSLERVVLYFSKQFVLRLCHFLMLFCDG